VIHGFDTFEGFPSVDVKDGANANANAGDYKLTEEYEGKLARLLKPHERFVPMNDLVKHRLGKGYASVTIDRWLEVTRIPLFPWPFLIWIFTSRPKMNWKNHPLAHTWFIAGFR
jgi:hypothetical protein